MISSNRRAQTREGAQRIREFVLNAVSNSALAPGAKLPTEREHRSIVQALKERGAERARGAILGHLQHARRNLIGD